MGSRWYMYKYRHEKYQFQVTGFQEGFVILNSKKYLPTCQTQTYNVQHNGKSANHNITILTSDT